MMELKYTGCTDLQVSYGGHDDPRGILEVDMTYTLEYKDVYDWHTDIKLVGIKGHFNSACFEVEEKEQ